MIPTVKYFPVLIAWALWLVPVVAWCQGLPEGHSVPAEASHTADKIVVAASMQRLIARASFNPLNRQNPPASPLTVLPAQNEARLLKKIRATMKANGYLIEAYRLDSLSCRLSKAADAMSKDKYLLWLESTATTASKDSTVKVFVQYGNFIHFWGTPAGQESAAMTSAGEYEKKIKLLKSVLDAMPR